MQLSCPNLMFIGLLPIEEKKKKKECELSNSFLKIKYYNNMHNDKWKHT